MDQLSNWRDRIDQIDLQILELLRERARLAQQIARWKQKENLPLYHPGREGEILGRLLRTPHDPLPDQAVRAVFREILSACRSVARPPRVAFLGPLHSFSHLACEEHLGTFAEFFPQPTIADVFRQVERKAVDFGVVPAENLAEGAVGDTLDCLLNTSAKIIGEVLLEINHCLLSRTDDVNQIKRVYSRDIALAQCRNWLRDHLPTAEQVAVASTAEGAVKARDEEGAAAIGPARAAEAYELKVLAERIQDTPVNQTRFWVLGSTLQEPSGYDKTTIAFSVPHRPGTLHRALGALREHQINMTMIASRPARHTPWEYIFFVDFQGHVNDEPVKKALEEMNRDCLFLKVLGSYPEALEAL
ncbi:MAG: prephenate dehydratase [Armatimonadetes bacterium]|nr:prephenate dehydratase [Armatimonadota bacterium]MDW8122067.1 prephenate dehydratase [Armatimonadota bacterium]